MIAVTIGTGRYELLARRAARAVEEMTGLQTLILTEEHFAASRLPTPHFLKLRIFDLAEAESVMFFDADIVCLNPWCPQEFGNQDAIVAVADRAVFKDVCLDWNIPLGEYINTGFFILNRALHHPWLRETERFIASQPPMDFWDQAPLNIVRHQLGLRLKLLDRRYNWLDVGNGSLSYKVPIFMAHKIIASSGMANMEYFEGRYKPPFQWCIEIDEEETDGLRGQILRLRNGMRDMCMYFNEDGTLGPFESPLSGSYWFVRKDCGRPILAIASETEILQEFAKSGDGTWQSSQHLEVQTPRALALTRDLVANRWFRYKQCGQKARNIELLSGGRIGHGASPDELFWYLDDDGKDITLLLGAERRDTCWLRWEPNLRCWEGRKTIQEGARIKMSRCY